MVLIIITDMPQKVKFANTRTVNPSITTGCNVEVSSFSHGIEIGIHYTDGRRVFIFLSFDFYFSDINIFVNLHNSKLRMSGF